MPPRARRLSLAGLSVVTAGLVAVGCGGSPARTSPSLTSGSPVAASPTPIPTPQIVGTTRTVLSPLGLRIHSTPALGSANVIGDAAQGATFTVIAYQSGGGGWLRVQGRSVTGWIVADPALTAAGTFNRYGAANGTAALYPQSWGFQQEPYGVIFLPQQGMQSILLETAPALASFGPPGLPGYTQSTNGTVEVCGYTATLAEYAKNASAAGATTTPLPVPRLALYTEIRIRFDSTHAMLIGFNYQNSSQVDVFNNLYDSITFPFPLCEAPATPTPTPAR